MSTETSTSEFFTAGGTLRLDSPSYVKRPADEELFSLALAGEFCYVLTARQMGKSSLMVRTANQLKEQGVSTAIIDLTKIGTVGVDQWYLGLLIRLRVELKLSLDPEVWWQAHAWLGRVQRFTDFLREVVLTKIKGQVVIFIDEIDTTLKLDFTDDFFAAIRAVYNARADDPEFKRLTFVLLGVATPADLIKDRARTPFNIGQGIALQEFSQADAGVLQAGLEAMYPGQGEVIFRRIYHWTSGHPYLTQKLCATAVDTEADTWDDKQVDRLVEQLFLLEQARRETNLQFIRDGIQTSPNRRRLLTIYRHVYQSEVVPDDEHSLDKSRLKLLGLVKREGRVLQVRNEIYHRVFNLDWIKANTPIDWTRRISVAATIIAVLLVGLLGYLTFGQPQPSAEGRAQSFVDTFRGTTSADVRVVNLSGLFQIPGYEEQARALFFDELVFEDQVALFERVNAEAVSDQLIIVVRGVYTHLDDNSAGNQILQVMAKSLRRVDDSVAARNLATEIEQWKAGRNYAAQQDFQYAVNAYDAAIDLNPDNIGTHFDRALVYTELRRYEDTLGDFEAVLEIISRTPPTPTPTQASSPTPPSISAVASISTTTPTTLSVRESPVPGPIISSVPTATISIPPSSAQRFASLKEIAANVEERVCTDISLIVTLSGNQSHYSNLSRTLKCTDAVAIVSNSPFSNLVLARGITAENQPLSPGNSFTAGAEPIYLFFDYQGIPSSTRWGHIWIRNGQELDRYITAWPEDRGAAGKAWVFYMPEGGYQPGLYNVRLLVNDHPVAAAAFTIKQEMTGDKTPEPTGTLSPSGVPTQPNIVTVTLSPTPEAVVIWEGGLNLRPGPGTDYDPPIGYLRSGDILDITGRTAGNEWIQVIAVYRGLKGWVPALPEYVEINVDLDSVPIFEAPPIPVPAPLPQPPLPSYSPPVLTAPDNGIVVENQIPPLYWNWDRELGENEYFEVRIWHESIDSYHTAIGWVKTPQFDYNVTTERTGKYYWTVLVVEGKNARIKDWWNPGAFPYPIWDGDLVAELSLESEPRFFFYSGVPKPAPPPP